MSQTLRDGMAAVLARDFEAAYPLLQRATIESPADVRPWLWCAVASSSPADAISCLRRVLLYEPSHSSAQHALARLLVRQAITLGSSGQHEQALAHAREAANLAPDCDAAWIGLAEVSPTPPERLDALRRAHDLNPDATRTRMLMRDALLHCGITAASSDPERARSFFREAATLDPKDPRAWQALARVATHAGDALDALRQLFRLTPDRPGVRATLRRALAADAQAQAAAGETAEAAARWREATTIDNTDAAAWLELAATTQDSQEAHCALGIVDRAGLSDPRVAALRDRWALPPLGSSPAAAPAAAVVPTIAEPPAPPVSIPAPPAEPAASQTEPAPSTATGADPAEVKPFARLAPPIAMPAAPAGEPTAPPHVAEPSAKRTVMVVDDSPTVRKILSMTLERSGYAVLTAADGEAALEALVDAVPDLILLDISMPKLDGYDVCKRIKSETRLAHVPVVMLSGKDAFFDKVKGRMAGATEYLTKPFATPAVLAVIARHLEAEASAAHG